jgi:uncharacterized protein (TIGR03437 family)
MKTCLSILAACTLFAAAASAQPVVGGLANNYSYIAAGLPNYGIAQGSILDIFGTNLVSTNLSLQSVPLKTTQNGVTVNVTVGTTTTHPYLYSMFHGSPDEIAAVLPSATPVGTGTLTVTTSAGTSATFPIVVVQSAFGILSLNQYGSGMGALQDYNDNYNELSLTNSAKPGDILVLWGTGLGPTTQDESQAQQETDFGSNLPIEVDIGGISAAIAYHGRSVFPGLDEVIVTVPQNLSGCNISIVVLSKNNNIVSNVVSAPVGANGGACSDPTAGGGVTPAVYQKCASSGCTIGNLGIDKTTSITPSSTIQVAGQTITIPGSTTVNDAISGDFYRYTPAEFATGIYGPSAVSIGSCSVYTFSYSGQTAPTVPTGATATPLNAGTITATTPNTTATMLYQNGFYSASGTGGTLIPANGGTFSFTNGSGGPDIGALSGAQITLGAPLVWTNPPTTVTRSSGLTANWSGGTSGTSVVLFGYSLAFAPDSTTSYVAAYFWCSAPVSNGSISVPSTVLLALPASGSITESGVSIPLNGALALSNQSNYTTFTAPNLDYGYLGGTYTTSQSVVFQ